MEELVKKVAQNTIRDILVLSMNCIDEIEQKSWSEGNYIEVFIRYFSIILNKIKEYNLDEMNENFYELTTLIENSMREIKYITNENNCDHMYYKLKAETIKTLIERIIMSM